MKPLATGNARPLSRGVLIVDIDNCIANDEWRIPMIDWDATDPDARYHRYHAGAYYDAPDISWLLARIEAMDEQPRVFLLTSRPTRYARMTQLWLAEHCKQLPLCGMLMRNDNDHRPSVDVKRQQLTWLFGGDYDVIPSNIIHCYDDHAAIVDMYRGCGLEADIHAIHNTCAYTNPLLKRAPQLSVPEILRSGAATFEQRNVVYGDNYKHFGTAMRGMFPSGLHVNSAEDWNRLGILIQCASKLTRYSQSFASGGHTDSAHDLSVYAAMLQELTQ